MVVNKKLVAALVALVAALVSTYAGIDVCTNNPQPCEGLIDLIMIIAETI